MPDLKTVLVISGSLDSSLTGLLWEGDLGVAANVVGAFILTLILLAPAAFCAGLAWRMIEVARDICR